MPPRFKRNLCLKKGLIFIVSLFSFCAETQETSNPELIYKQTVEKSQALMLDQKRSEAIHLANQSLQRLSSADVDSGTFRAKLKKLVLTFSKTFLTEEGQRLHGLGVDAIVESPKLAATWFLSAHKQEKQSNILIVKDLARLYLSEQRCMQALRTLEPAMELVPFDTGLVVYNWQALECLDRGAEAFEKMSEQLLQELSYQPNLFVEIYKVRSQVRHGQLEEGRLRLEQLKKAHPKFPEVSFWQWKLDPTEGKIDISHAQEYVKLCQTLSLRYRTELFQQGFLCGHIPVVEAYLKQN
jgi:hypothetical protein